MEQCTTMSAGDAVLSGLSGQLICSYLSNCELRSLSECCRHLHALATGSITALAPKKLTSGTLQRRFSHLQVLDLSRDQCKWNICASHHPLSGLHHLHHLRLQRCLHLTDALLPELLSNITSLTSIDVRGCAKLTWCGLGQLTALTRLRTLNCSGIKSSIDVEAPGPATPLHQLLAQIHSLTMGDACTLSSVDDRLMAVVGAHAACLTELDCSGCIDISDNGVSALSGLGQLRTLGLQSCVRLTDGCMATVAKLSSLEDLSLRGCQQITHVGLRQLTSLIQLQSLDLTSCIAVEEVEEVLLGSLKRLARLDMSGCVVTSLDKLPALAGSIRNLSIANCSKLPLGSLAALSALTGLHTLDMSGIRNRGALTADTNRDLQRLSCLSNLQTLQISRFSHPQGLPHGLLLGVAGMTALRDLRLANCCMSGSGSAAAERDTWVSFGSGSSFNSMAAFPASTTSAPLPANGDDAMHAISCHSEQQARAGSWVTDASTNLTCEPSGDISSLPLPPPLLPPSPCLPSSQLWFLEGLTRLQHLDLSGWRHAHASSLISLKALTQLTELHLQRFANDTSASNLGGTGPPVVAPVHTLLQPVRCPGPVVDCREGSDASTVTSMPPQSSGTPGGSGHPAGRGSGGGCDPASSDAAGCGDGWAADRGLPIQETEIDILQRQMAAVGIRLGGGRTAAAAKAEAEGGKPAAGSIRVAAACCSWWPSCFCYTASPSATLTVSTQTYAPIAPPNSRQPSLLSVHALPSLMAMQMQMGARVEDSGSLDQGLSHLSGLSRLQVLNLEACVGLQDSGLAHLAPLQELRWLHLAGCVRLTGKTLHLLRGSGQQQQASGRSGQQEPQEATSSGPKVQPGAIQSSSSIPGVCKLEKLCLDDCPLIGASALDGLASVGSLRVLSMRGCARVDDQGLHALAGGLSRLMSLSLFSAGGITASGLRCLSRLPYLKTLHLSHCWNVDDEALVQLAECRDLATLSLQHCWRVSEGALQAMQQASPALDIVRG